MTHFSLFWMFYVSLSSILISAVYASKDNLSTASDQTFVSAQSSPSSLNVPFLSDQRNSGIPNIQIQAPTPKHNESATFPIPRQMDVFGRPLLTPEYTSTSSTSSMHTPLSSAHSLQLKMKEAVQKRKQRIYGNLMIFFGLCGAVSSFGLVLVIALTHKEMF